MQRSLPFIYQSKFRNQTQKYLETTSRSIFLRSDYPQIYRAVPFSETLFCLTPLVRLAQMGIEDPSSHNGYRARALERRAQSQQRDRGEVEDRE